MVLCGYERYFAPVELRACVRLFGAAFVLLIPLLLDPSASRQTDQPWTGVNLRTEICIAVPDRRYIRAVIPAGQGKDAERPRLRALKAADDQ
jgi:hypothetical protein